ncbi:MAG: 50S ribosomal protein L29 [Nanoarchaeota archaeon]|nr:50S ribosomal protein L29 [Nanoarchaeota archaeon]
MASEKKILTEKELNKKIKDLKIEILKNPTKKKSIKKEIARLLTVGNQTKLEGVAPKGVPQKTGGRK